MLEDYIYANNRIVSDEEITVCIQSNKVVIQTPFQESVVIRDPDDPMEIWNYPNPESIIFEAQKLID